MTGIACECAVRIRACRSESVPRYPGSVKSRATGPCSTIFSNSATEVPVGTPVAVSIWGESHIGSNPAKTSALNTERCALRVSATLSPGFPRAKMMAWLAWVDPPVEKRAYCAPHSVAARPSAFFKVWLVNLISSRPPYRGVSLSTTWPSPRSNRDALCLCPGIVNGWRMLSKYVR